MKRPHLMLLIYALGAFVTYGHAYRALQRIQNPVPEIAIFASIAWPCYWGGLASRHLWGAA